MPSLAHAKANPAVICARSARPLSIIRRQPARYVPLKTQALSQTRHFTVTTTMASMRTESDAFGEIQVPSDKYWGAQTERSLENFRINQPQDRMPPPIVRAFGILKGAAATVNIKYGLGTAPSHTSSGSTNEIQTLSLERPFSGLLKRLLLSSSSTTSLSLSGRPALVPNPTMNANEVISNRAIEILGGTMGSKEACPPQ